MSANAFIEKISVFFMLQWGWKRSASAFLAGSVSALAMPPADMFPVLFVTFPILIWLIDGTAAEPGHGPFARVRSSFLIGWNFAFGYFLFSLWWIGNALLVEAKDFAWMLPFATLGIPAFLALFWAAAIAISQIFWSDDWRRLAMLSVFLSLAEYARATVLTGFPWNTIGYAAMTTPLTMQTVSILGVHGVTPLAILVFSSPALLAPVSGHKSGHVRFLLIFPLTLAMAHAGFGYWRLHNNPPRFVKDVRLRIVQPAIKQKDKWLPENETRIFNSYIDLSSAPGKNITHYIWPESAFPFILTQRKDALARIAEMLPEDAYLITGATRMEEGSVGKSRTRIFNSIYVINHKGEIMEAADKSHLVPFGEYLPFQNYAEELGLAQLTGIEGGYDAAMQRRILSAGAAGNFLPLICYEIIFSGQIMPERSGVARNFPLPGWIVNVTNDAWFGNTPGPYQHHRQAVIRGVEEGLPVVRAANNGISSVSDPYGRILAAARLGQRGNIDSKLPLPAPATFFQDCRNKGFFLICLVLFLVSTRYRVQ